MRRMIVGLAVGVAIGVIVTLAMPDLLYERRTVSLARGTEWEDVEQATIRDGWRIVRVDDVDDKVLYQLERLRLRLPVSDIAPVIPKPAQPAR